MVFGDYIAGDPRWVAMRQRAIDFGAAIKRAGGSVDFYDLQLKLAHWLDFDGILDR
jgi:hypothetical protein